MWPGEICATFIHRVKIRKRERTGIDNGTGRRKITIIGPNKDKKLGVWGRTSE